MSVFDLIHLLHGARGGEGQPNRICMQESVSMFSLSVFDLSVFVLFLHGTNSSVHPSTFSIFCLLYFCQVSRSNAAFKI